MGTRHDEIGVGILIAKVGKNFGIGTRIVAKPVVIVDPDVAEHLHFMLHLPRCRRSCGAATGPWEASRREKGCARRREQGGERDERRRESAPAESIGGDYDDDEALPFLI